MGCDRRYGYLLHDRDAIFSAELDESIRRLELRVLKSPPRRPKANSICEHVIGTIRRECLHWLIPFSEAHLRQTLKAWVTHYNRGRPHSALGPGVPDPPVGLSVPLSKLRHRLADFRSVHAKEILVDRTTSTHWRACDQNRSSQDRSGDIIAEDSGDRLRGMLNFYHREAA